MNKLYRLLSVLLNLIRYAGPIKTKWLMFMFMFKLCLFGIFLTATWLSQGQLWATVKGATSLGQC